MGSVHGHRRACGDGGVGGRRHCRRGIGIGIGGCCEDNDGQAKAEASHHHHRTVAADSEENSPTWRPNGVESKFHLGRKTPIAGTPIPPKPQFVE
jgi:hypothetical protein